eukprot:gene17098-17289_t
MWALMNRPRQHARADPRVQPVEPVPILRPAPEPVVVQAPPRRVEVLLPAPSPQRIVEPTPSRPSMASATTRLLDVPDHRLYVASAEGIEPHPHSDGHGDRLATMAYQAFLAGLGPFVRPIGPDMRPGKGNSVMAQLLAAPDHQLHMAMVDGLTEPLPKSAALLENIALLARAARYETVDPFSLPLAPEEPPAAPEPVQEPPPPFALPAPDDQLWIARSGLAPAPLSDAIRS